MSKREPKLLAQCPHCLSVKEYVKGYSNGKWIRCVAEFPKLIKEVCYQCKEKKHA